MLLVQVTESLRDPKTRQREYKVLSQATKELHVEKGLILTQEEEIGDEALPQIEVVAIYQWLLWK